MIKFIHMFSLTLFVALSASAASMAQDNASAESLPMGIATPAVSGEVSQPPSDPETAAPNPGTGAPAAETPDGLTSAVVPGTAVSQAVPGSSQTAINPNDIPSLLFTFWEHTALSDAKRSRGYVKPPTDAELMRDLKTRDAEKIKPPPEERDIRLGGIVYRTGADWTIWLNDQRVTPKAIPSEVMDLKVSKEYIEMKWFDEFTNQIFPIRLRPHQRFNIDTRIFLPG